MVSLTDKQQKVLSYIQKTAIKTEEPPTYREIADHLGVTVRSAYQHVVALEQKRALRRRSGHRAIELLSPYIPPRGLPILGRIAAGTPILAEENIEGRLELKDIQVGDEGQFFLLRVNGDSMVERGINPGDLVLIRQQSSVESGEIAAVRIEDEATLKVFRVKERKIYLEPANKKYRPIYLNKSKNAEILGKALMAIRFLEKGRAL
jgi:repressor LexA